MACVGSPLPPEAAEPMLVVDALALVLGLLENALEDGTLLPSGATERELPAAVETAQRALDAYWSGYRIGGER